ncbi:ribosome maturation factor RimM [Anaerolineales bacterium HSG24]|nr:ribosome maturation factor RimM [Anaerolineales bacterium HSG24]
MTGPVSPTKKNNRSRNSNSRQSELRYLAVGRVVKAHGLKGELSMVVMTDFPERFDTTEWLYLGDEFDADPYRLTSYRRHKSNLLLTLAEVTDRNQADALRGLLVQIPIEAAMPLPEGSYYLYQLMGLEVISTDDESLGVIGDIIETGANDVYVVKGKKDILIPNISDVVQSVDLEKKQMIVNILDGLI